MKDDIFFIRTDFLNVKYFSHPLHFPPPIVFNFVKSFLDSFYNKEFNSEVIDCCVERLDVVQLSSKVLKLAPMLIVMSFASFSSKSSIELAAIIKRNNKRIFIAGTGHDVASRAYKYVDSDSPIDIILPEESEQQIIDLIIALQKFKNNEKSRNFTRDKFYRRERVLNAAKLDDMPFPVYSKIELKKYNCIYPVTLRTKVTCGYVVSSRGCRHKCIFCTLVTRKSNSNPPQFRNPSLLAEDILKLKKAGVNLVFFMDDDFAMSRTHLLTICNEIIERKINIKWVASPRIDELDSEIIEIMKRAGCVLLLLSVESGSGRIIELLNKTMKPEKWLQRVEGAFRMARKLNIGTCALFIVGSPTESRADVEESIKVAKIINPDFIKVHFFTPYPGTIFFEQIKERLPEEMISNMHHYLPPVVNLSNMDTDALRRMQIYFIKNLFIDQGILFFISSSMVCFTF